MTKDALQEGNDVVRAFSTGIGSAGQGFSSGRAALLMYFIAFALRFKGLDRDGRTELLDDAWRFREQMARHILLHLLFPREFERIAAGRHKYRIGDAFGGLLAGDSDKQDIDRRLWAIRQQICELMPGGQPNIGGAIDFYETPLQEGWDPEEEDPSEDEGGISHLSALEQKRQVVLYGPLEPARRTRLKIWHVGSSAIRRSFDGRSSISSGTCSLLSRWPNARSAGCNYTRTWRTRTSSAGCELARTARRSLRTATYSNL